MKTQIRRYGNSKVILLSNEFMEYMNLEVGDWVDICDIIKVEKKNE